MMRAPVRKARKKDRLRSCIPGLISSASGKIVLIVRDHSHYSPDDTGICAHCGQPLPTGHGHVHGYENKRSAGIGLAVTVALHLGLLLLFLLRSQLVTK